MNTGTYDLWSQTGARGGTIARGGRAENLLSLVRARQARATWLFRQEASFCFDFDRIEGSTIGGTLRLDCFYFRDEMPVDNTH